MSYRAIRQIAQKSELLGHFWMKNWLYQLCVLVYMLSYGSLYFPY